MKSSQLILLLTSVSLSLPSSAFSSQPLQNSTQNHEPTNISHIVFGLAGSVNTWKNRSRYSELWWTTNVTRGYVWLDKAPDMWLPKWPPFRVSEDCSQFKYSSSLDSVRIARIILETFRLGFPNTRWFVMGDDDTVFFPDNLVSVLTKYDDSLMYYIGASSESVEQNVVHSYGMAFGGGGFAVSYPLAAELVKVLDGCLDRYYALYGGDEKVAACISDIGVSLTRESGFHQFDIRGDPYGILAAHPMAPVVSLHHLDVIDPLFLNWTQQDSLANLYQAYRADPARTLQQTMCYNHEHEWSVSVSWGYTVQIYPSLVTAKDLEIPLATFRTWRSVADGPFTFNTRPMTNDPGEEPGIYFLDGVKEVGKGESVSEYSRLGEKLGNRGSGPPLAVSRIAVSAVKMDHEHWNKVTRRQCCEIMDPKTMQNGTLLIQIRRCNPRETITT